MVERTFTCDTLKTYIKANTGRFGSDDAVMFARQLYDALVEIEKLRNKHSDHIGDTNKMVQPTQK